MSKWKTEAVLLAIGLTALGAQIKQGINNFVEKDRVVLKKYEPSCIFCGSSEAVKEFKGKNI